MDGPVGQRMIFVARVYIDDVCDVCSSGQGKQGISFGPDKPVICSECLGRATTVLQTGAPQVVKPSKLSM